LDVSVYLLGDGVLLAKEGPMGKDVKEALGNGVEVLAAAKDLKARGVGRTLEEVERVEDLEDLLVEDAMERADKVISW
jgi:sulfur relay protein TusB/DsrH